MKKIESDVGYIEGVWSAKSVVKHIANSIYNNIHEAIAIKTEVVSNFENQFGYSREMDVEQFDYNYAHTVGMLDGLKKILEDAPTGSSI